MINGVDGEVRFGVKEFGGYDTFGVVPTFVGTQNSLSHEVGSSWTEFPIAHKNTLAALLAQLDRPTIDYAVDKMSGQLLSAAKLDPRLQRYYSLLEDRVNNISNSELGKLINLDSIDQSREAYNLYY